MEAKKMLQQTPIESLFDRLKVIYPGFKKRSEDFSGYFIKKIEYTECCLYSVKKQEKPSNQYHIQVTGVTEQMTLFPMVTSFEYFNEKDSAQKGKYKSKTNANYPVLLFIPNLIKKINSIIDNYDIFVHQYNSKNPKDKLEKLVLTKDDYIDIKTKLESIEQKQWVITLVDVVVAMRKDGPPRIEIGPKQPANYSWEFIIFRKLMLPGDHLIVIKKNNLPEYIFLILSDEQIKENKMDKLTCFFIDIEDKTSLTPEISDDKVKKAEVNDDEGQSHNPNIYFYPLSEEVLNVENKLEVNLKKNETSQLDCKMHDLIFLTKEMDQEYLVGIGEILSIVEIEEHTSYKLKIIQKVDNIPIEKLIAEGYVDENIFKYKTIDEEVEPVVTGVQVELDKND